MPDVKISQLPAADVLTGAELVPVVQGGVTKQVLASALVGPAGPAAAAIAAHAGDANPHPQYVLQQQLGTVLADYPVSLANNLQPGDHLEFDGSKWANIPKESLVDGGNF